MLSHEQGERLTERPFTFQVHEQSIRRLSEAATYALTRQSGRGGRNLHPVESQNNARWGKSRAGVVVHPFLRLPSRHATRTAIPDHHSFCTCGQNIEPNSKSPVRHELPQVSVGKSLTVPLAALVTQSAQSDNGSGTSVPAAALLESGGSCWYAVWSCQARAHGTSGDQAVARLWGQPRKVSWRIDFHQPEGGGTNPLCGKQEGLMGILLFTNFRWSFHVE